MPQLTFLGAAGTVSGSRHLLEVNGRQVLFDCGLFQGERSLRRRNWKPLGVPPQGLDAVILTHGHIDHSGWLPRLAKEGFQGPIYTTAPTADLLGLLLYDSAKCQMEDAAYANRKGFSKHHPALPLYEDADVARVLQQLRVVQREGWFEPCAGVRCRLHDAGHMLGSSYVEVEAAREQVRPLRLIFSGDVGRYDAPLYNDPLPPPACDVLVCESTYGDRDHPDVDPLSELERLVNEAVDRGGLLLAASFAVGRTQQLVYLLRILIAAGRIPELPIWIDSPMAVEATRVFRKHAEEHDLSEAHDAGVAESLKAPWVRMSKTPNESKAINREEGPGIVIASSGMMTGGRILHHLKRRLSDPKTTVLVTGFQPKGTRGRSLLDGAATLRIHGRDVPVQAAVRRLDGLSGHADRREMVRWLADLPQPERVFLVHGETSSARGMARQFQEAFGWQAEIPGLGDSYSLR
ncbi:MAG: MBL fold metallo-hydrolase [Pirellulales bacterium]|jgi:metallo-beta-lactamase family protein|nr:MBL fold metallo-hydrolase [Pirellulales bacterium]